METFVRWSRNAFTTPLTLSSLRSPCSHRQEYRNFESCFSDHLDWLQFSASSRLCLITFATYTFLRRGMEPSGVCTENGETSTGDVCVCVCVYTVLYCRFSQIEIFFKRVNIRDVLASLTCIRNYSDCKE